MADPKRTISWEKIFDLQEVKPSYKNLLLQQLEKDLHIFFSSESPEIIFKEVYEALESAIHKNELPQLLYRIDVPEKQFQQTFYADNQLEALAWLIMVREATKVLTRIQYSQD